MIGLTYGSKFMLVPACQVFVLMGDSKMTDNSVKTLPANAMDAKQMALWKKFHEFTSVTSEQKETSKPPQEPPEIPTPKRKEVEAESSCNMGAIALYDYVHQSSKCYHLKGLSVDMNPEIKRSLLHQFYHEQIHEAVTHLEDFQTKIRSI